MAWQLIASPIIGALGGLAQSWLELKKESAKAQERAAERAHELAVMDREAEIAVKRMTVEQELRNEETQNETFRKSYEVFTKPLLPEGTKLNAAQKWVALFIDSSVTVIRPLCVVYYQLLLAVVAGWAMWILYKDGTPVVEIPFAQDLMKDIIYSIIGLSEMTVGWFFGVRGVSRRGK